jgi:signal peptidase II
MVDRLRHYFSLIGASGLLVAADQWSKYLIRMRLAPGEQWAPSDWLQPYARLINSSNTGAAFGIFPDGGLIFTVIAILVSAAILYYFPRVPRGQWYVRLALALQLGGAVGNLIDRLLQSGRVTDFISLGEFPVFNLADASISAGVTILVITMLLEERRGKRSGAEAEAEVTTSEAERSPS